jgi:hypothetical protein
MLLNCHWSFGIINWVWVKKNWAPKKLVWVNTKMITICCALGLELWPWNTRCCFSVHVCVFWFFCLGNHHTSSWIKYNEVGSFQTTLPPSQKPTLQLRISNLQMFFLNQAAVFYRFAESASAIVRSSAPSLFLHWQLGRWKLGLKMVGQDYPLVN